DLSGAMQLLGAAPEVGFEQLGMCTQKSVSQGLRQPKEGEELLGEDVALSDVIPRLAAHLLLVAAGQRQVAKVAIGHQTQLVIVVEDDPPGAGDAEVLEQQIPGKVVGRCQVPNALAVIDDRRPRAVLTHLPNEQVEWNQPALGIQVRDVYLVPGDADVLAATREQLLQQLG